MMKHYLGLIPRSAKVRRRQNRMTILCIVLAVSLVTTIFSVAQQMVYLQSERMQDKHGSWHLQISGISQETAAEIATQEDVVSVGSVAVCNDDGALPYRLDSGSDNKRAALYGIDEAYLAMNSTGVAEGHFPQAADEILLSRNAAKVLQVSVGDSVTLHTPAGEQRFTVSGLGGVDESYYSGQYFLMDAYLPRAAFAQIMAQNGVQDAETLYYIQFTSPAAAAQAQRALAAQYGLPEDAVTENTAVMGMAGQSNSTAMQNIYHVAAGLFVLVLLAGVLMISGSMNSNLAQRIQFFGMMRCLGMSKAQIIRFVRLEALNWCKAAVPVGMVLGTLVSWGIGAVLHYGIGGEFSATPVFSLSLVGLVSGAVVGVVTVLLAAESPARRAACISPVAAVSGQGQEWGALRPMRTRRLRKVERALGIHHAVAGRKNWFLMTASFALTIVLALCFSVLLEFAGLLLPSHSPWQPDVLLSGYSNETVLPRSMADQLRTMPGVQTVWGATGLRNTPASSAQESVEQVTLCSYDSFMMACSQDLIAAGRLADQSADRLEAMTIYNKNNPLQVGDTVTIQGTTLTITGAFSQGMFSDDVTVICPQAVFDQAVGAQAYNSIGVLLDSTVTEETVLQIARLAEDDVIVNDLREQNQKDASTYWASRLVACGFLTILGLISLCSIINSISMSVSARTRQYGVLRAIGMDRRQLTWMIATEAGTYAVSGLVVGCVAGLFLNRALYARLITRYFGLAWHLPGIALGILALFVIAAAAIAVYAPAKRICALSVTETIQAL